MRRNPYKRPLIDMQTDGQLRYLEIPTRLLGRLDADDEINLKKALRSFLENYRIHNSTKYQAAVHEAGHFVAIDKFGGGAWSADISGSRGGHDGWRGEAQGYGDFWDFTQQVTSSRLTRLAKIFLAGPWAEHFIGGCRALNSPGEILAAQFLIAGAARLEGIAYDKHLDDTLSSVTAFLSEYEFQIEFVADALKRRRKILRRDRSIKTVLDSAHSHRTQSRPSIQFDDKFLKREIAYSLPISSFLKNYCKV